MEKIKPRTTLLITSEKLFSNCSSSIIDNYMNRIGNKLFRSGATDIYNKFIIPYPISDDDIHELMLKLNGTDIVEMVYPDITIDITPFKIIIINLIIKHPEFRNKFKMISHFEPLEPSDFEDSSDQKSKDTVEDIKDAINEESKSEKKPKEIIALIGSRKFIDTFDEIANKLSSEGNIVFTPDIFHEDTEKLHWKTIKAYEELYDFKIKLSSKVIVINKDGYIGKDTKREIDYANSLGKVIEYYEPISKPNENPIKSFKNDIKGCKNERLIPAAVNFVESSYKYMRPWAEITQELLNGKIPSSLKNLLTDDAITELSKRPIDELTPLELMMVFYKKIMEHPDTYNIKELMK